MQINADPPPFWSPPPNTSMPRRRSSSSSPLLSSPLLIILLPIIFLVFLFITIPPLLSFTFHILRPTYSVKRSWDSFNIVLVVIAILCGIFARKNDDGSTSNALLNTDKTTHEEEPTSQQQQQQRFQYSERKISDYDDPDPSRIWSPATGLTRLKRSSSSYPDLRQQDSTWERDDADDHPFRFFDDFGINKFNYNYNHNPVRRGSFGQEQEEEDVEVKEIPVDTFEIRSSPAPPKSPAPPPPPPPPPPQPKRTYETVGRKEKEAKQNDTQFREVKEEEKNIRRTPPPAPPPPPSPAGVRSEEQRYVKSGRKKSNVKKEIKMVLASIYKQRKRNKKKRKDPYDESLPSEADRAYSTRPLPSPPPPPPPPPPSVFHSFFKKGLIKSKKVHSVSVSAPPPPPPPPPPSTSTSSRKKTWVPPKLHRRSSSATIGKPPLPTRVTNWDKSESVNVGVNSGAQSPSIPMPPPPPPFKMPDMRFVVRGDFVKIRSAHSSRCGSPELEDVDGSSSVSVMDGGDGVVAGAGVGGSVFCPSPDVNTKADSFIARLHDGWRLEKVNSLREKQKMG
ncbi:uncharacterized protein LOC126701181 [Quercus robur]|uniref:uncharacterized protein LOC126701181 n=1 Tax=Quercus robur TaxID=38942 RepID=UPI002162E1BA|nr:uncharacterized protein LOC126701181 [Quercus robur]